MAVSLGAKKPPPKYGPTAGPWMPTNPAKQTTFQGGNDAWWRGLIAGQTGAGGNPRPLAESAPAWQSYAGALRGLAGGFGPQMNLQNPYRNMIGGDWDVQGTESAMNAAMGRARGDFQSQIRQALVDLGVTDKSKLGNLGQYIDADTISKAAENKYSRTAQISQAELRSRAQSEADLAARGMLSSGQLTQNAENIVAEGEQQRYGALRDFLGAGSQGLSQLADMQDQWSQQLMQSRFAAAQRAADLYNQAEMWDYEMGAGRYGAPTVAPVASTAAPKQPLYQAMGPYGPYGPAKYTQAQLNQMAKNYPWR